MTKTTTLKYPSYVNVFPRQKRVCFLVFKAFSLSLSLSHKTPYKEKLWNNEVYSLFNLQSSEPILIVQTSAVPTQKSVSTRWVAENDLDLVMSFGLHANAFTVKKWSWISRPNFLWSEKDQICVALKKFFYATDCKAEGGDPEHLTMINRPNFLNHKTYTLTWQNL